MDIQFTLIAIFLSKSVGLHWHPSTESVLKPKLIFTRMSDGGIREKRIRYEVMGSRVAKTGKELFFVTAAPHRLNYMEYIVHVCQKACVKFC